MGLVINLKINNAPSGSRPSEPMSPDFTEWLTRNPQPALQDLVQRYGAVSRYCCSRGLLQPNGSRQHERDMTFRFATFPKRAKL